MRSHLYFLLAFAATVSHLHAGTKVTFDSNGVLEVDGKKMFVISVAVPPPPDGKTPDGKDAFAELRDGGCNYMRVTMRKREDDAPKGPRWTEEGFGEIQKVLDALAKNQMYGWTYLYELGDIAPDSPNRDSTLKKVIERFKDHPANGGWKGADEPAWSNGNDPKRKRCTPENILHVYKLIHEFDQDHPVLILHAPKGDWQGLVPYMAGTDVTGLDIFPIGYPPGRHGDLPNRDLSMVGDYVQWIKRAAGNKPIWMTLQFAWSGVANKVSVLRFPTFPQERFMTYQAIIFGARGVNYFGGAIESTLNERDKPLGYNWTFWQRVLRPVLEEINDKSPLYPALLEPDSKLKVNAEQLLAVAPGMSVKEPTKTPPVLPHYPPARGLDFCVREVGNEIFIIAARREGETVLVRFTGLPGTQPVGDVLFESPRKIKVDNSQFDDWFGPDEVHVYRIKRR